MSSVSWLSCILSSMFGLVDQLHKQQRAFLISIRLITLTTNDYNNDWLTSLISIVSNPIKVVVVIVVFVQKKLVKKKKNCMKN